MLGPFPGTNQCENEWEGSSRLTLLPEIKLCLSLCCGVCSFGIHIGGVRIAYAQGHGLPGAGMQDSQGIPRHRCCSSQPGLSALTACAQGLRLGQPALGWVTQLACAGPRLGPLRLLPPGLRHKANGTLLNTVSAQEKTPLVC